MKNYLLSTLILLSSIITTISAVPTDNERQAILGALEQITNSITTAPLGKKTIAILPIIYSEEWNQSHYGDTLSGPLKNTLTKAGFSCIEGKEDPMMLKGLTLKVIVKNKKEISGEGKKMSKYRQAS